LADLQAAVTVGKKVVPVISSAQTESTRRPKKGLRVFEAIKEEPQDFIEEEEEEEMPIQSEGEPKSYELKVASERRMTRKKSVAIRQPHSVGDVLSNAVSESVPGSEKKGSQLYSGEEAMAMGDVTRENSYRPADRDFRCKYIGF
jgi:hypothetical protein